MKKTLYISTAVLVVLGLAAWAWASVSDTGCSPRLLVAETILKLDLNQEQKTRLAGILKKNETAIKAELASLTKARGKLVNALAENPGDTDGLRAAYAELSQAGEKAVLLAGKLAPRLQAVLTPAQQELFQRQRAKMKEALACRRQAKTGLMEQWIERQLR